MVNDKGMHSPSGRHTILDREAAGTLMGLDEDLAAGRWSLTMQPAEKVSYAIGMLLGVMSHRTGWTVNEAKAQIDEELIAYVELLLAKFEQVVLERMMK